uniref:Uncharacterized protein n=1 Tax=Anopheles quadriannulatus TaxID=34691 RepID=A0A182XT29_ANOQN
MTKKTSTIGHFSASTSGTVGQTGGMSSFGTGTSGMESTDKQALSSSGQQAHQHHEHPSGIGGKSSEQQRPHQHQSQHQSQHHHHHSHHVQQSVGKMRDKHTVHW